MGKVESREIKFLVTLRNEMQSGVAGFKKDIKEINDAVASVRGAMEDLQSMTEMSGKGGATAFGTATTMLKEFITTLGEFGKKGKEKSTLEAFKSISTSFEKISKGITVAENSMTVITRVVEQLNKAAGSIKDPAGISRVTEVFKEMAGIVKALSAGGDTEKASTFFKSLSEAAARFGQGGTMVTAIKDIANTKDELTSVASLLEKIVTLMSSPGLESGASAMARALTGIGVGGGGGAPSSYINWSGMSGGMIERLSKDVEKRGIDKETINAFDKYINKVRFVSQEMDAFVKQMVDKKSGDISGLVSQMEKGLSGVFSASELSSIATKSTYAEAIPGEIQSLGLFRGTVTHKAIEETLKHLGVGKGGIIGESFIEMITSQAYKTEQFAINMANEAKSASAAFKAMVSEGLSKGGVNPEAPKIKEQIERAAGNLEREFITWSRNFFPMLRERAVKAFGGDIDAIAKGLQSTRIELEKPIQALTMIKPGGGLDIQGELKESAQRYLRTTIKQMRTVIGDKSQFKEFMTTLKQRGLAITGTLDLLVDFGKQFEKLIIDWKTGYADPKGMYTVLQQMIYQIGTARQLGVPIGKVKSLIGATRTGTFSPSGMDVSATEVKGVAESFQKENELAKENSKLTEEQVKLMDQLIARNKELEAIKQRLNSLEKSSRASAQTKVASVAAIGGGAAGGAGGGGPISEDPERLNRIVVIYDNMSTVIERLQMVKRDAALATSKFTEALTSAYYRQEMLGEKTDITSARMTQYSNIISSIATTFGKFFIVQEGGASVQDRVFAQFERFNNIGGAVAKNYEKINTLIEKRNNLLSRAKYELGESTNRNASGVKTGTVEDFYATMSKVGAGDTSKKLKVLALKMREFDVQIGIAEKDYKEFTHALIAGANGSDEFKLSTEKSTEELKEFFKILREVDEEFARAPSKIGTAEQAIQRITQAIERQRTVALKSQLPGGGSFQTMIKDTSGFVNEINQKWGGITSKFGFTDPSKAFGLEPGRMATTIRAVTDYINELNAKRKVQEELMSRYELKLKKIEIEEGKSSAIYMKKAKELDILSRSYNAIYNSLSGYEDKLRKLQQVQRLESERTAEHFRGDIRTTLKGFQDMMRSQAAWVLGYGVMFGAIRGFKDALMSVVTVQHELARAMRTARQEGMAQAEIFNMFSGASTTAMLKYGQGIENISEALYQLGSAGLNAKESVAALNSTMDAIVASEDEAQSMTKLTASVYNNFAESIKGATTLEEKFKYINDILIATFDIHQVELNELRDGYQHLMAMGKASNLTFLEMSSILGVLNDHLIRSGMAGRSVQRMLAKISDSPVAFAKAFGVAMDPEAPLNLIEILREIGTRMDKGALSISQVGDVFDRMGIIGAKGFISLVRNINKVDEDIQRLKDTSVDSAERMAQVMLDKPDVAFGRMKQTLAALIREGFEPLVKIMQITATGVSLVGYEFSSMKAEWPKAIGGVALNVVGLSSAFLVLTSIIGGLRNRFARGTRDWQTYYDVVGKFNERIINLKSGFSALGSPFQIAGVSKMTTNISKLRYAYDSLAIAVMGSVGAFTIFLSLLGAYVIYKFIDWLIVTNKEYTESINKMTQAIDVHKQEIDALQNKINSVKGLDEASKAYKKTLEDTLKLRKENMLYDIEEDMKSMFKDMPKKIKETGDELDKVRKQIEMSSKLGFKDSGALFGIGQAPDIKKTAKASREFATQMLSALTIMKEKLKSMREDPAFRELADKLLSDFNMKFTFIIQNLKKLAAEAGKDLGGKVFEEAQKSSKGIIDLLNTARNWAKESGKEFGSLIAEEIAIGETGPITRLKRDIKELKRKIGKETEGWGISVSTDDIGNLAEYLREQGKTEGVYKDLIGLIEKYKDAMVKLGVTTKEVENSSRTLNKSFEDLIYTTERNIDKTISGFVQDNLVKILFSADAEAIEKQRQAKKMVEDFVLDWVKATDDIKQKTFEMFGESVGAKSVGDYFDKRMVQITRYQYLIEELANREADLAKKDVMRQMLDRENKSALSHEKSMQDLQYRMKEYHTVEEVVAKDMSDRKNEVTAIVDKINEQSRAIENLKLVLSTLSEDEVKRIDAISKSIEYYEKEIDRLKKELKQRKETNQVETERLTIQERIRQAQEKFNMVIKLSNDLIEYGDVLYGRSFATQGFILQQMAERLQLEKTLQDMIARGLINETDKVRILADFKSDIARREYESRVDLENKILNLTLERLQKQAEAEYRGFKETEGQFDWFYTSLKAGTYGSWLEVENISKAVTDGTRSAIDMTTGMMTDMTMQFVQGSKDGLEGYKQILASTLQEAGKELTAYGMKLLFIYVLKKAMGMVAGSAGGSEYGANFNYSFGGGGTPVEMAGGGILRGGIKGRDSILILGSDGEYMMPKDSVDYYGADLMERLRRKDIKKMQDGGSVGGISKTTVSTSDGEESQPTTIIENHFHIQAMDAASFSSFAKKHSGIFGAAVVHDYRNDGISRKGLKG